MDSITANSTINLNYDDFGYYQSHPMVCGGGNMGTLTGNSIINVDKNAPSQIYCGGFTGNVAGTTTVNVMAVGKEEGSQYAIRGERGDGNPNVGGESTVKYINFGTFDKTQWVGFVQGVDNMILTDSIVIMNGDSEKPLTKNLTVGSTSSLSIQGNPFHITSDFSGGGSIISESGGVLLVDGTVSGVTTLDFDKSIVGSPSDTEVKIVTAPKATAGNFKLHESRSTDYTLMNSGNDWKAVKNTSVPLHITTSENPTYGETIQVTVTATGNVTTTGEVKLEVIATNVDVTDPSVFTGKVNLNASKSAVFNVPLTKGAGNHTIKAIFTEYAAKGQAQISIEVAKLPLTISGIQILDREYDELTQVNIPFSCFENATLSGYLSGDSGAVLENRIYYAQLKPSDLDVGNNKKIIFAPDAKFLLARDNLAQISMYNKYYVPAPKNLTVNIKKQVLKTIVIPVPIGSIGLGQSLKDVTLQVPGILFDCKWQYPDTKPEIGNQTSYPTALTSK